MRLPRTPPSLKLLVAGTLSALNTANAYRPLAQRVPASTIPSGPAAWITTELPLQTIATQQLATLVLAGRGALRSRVGRAGLALSAASWVALVNLYREAQRSEAVLEDALARELGSDYRSRIVAPLTPPVDGPLTRAEVALAPRGSRSRYLRAADAAYGEYGKRNLLDVWAREDLASDARAPVLIQIPGGAWVAGRKTGQSYPLMSHLAERGWVCVSISHRLAPKAKWPAHIVDVKRAIAWVKEHIAEYGGDPSFVALTGGSSGGHLTALAALTPNEPGFQPGFEDADTAVQAAVPMYGVYDFVDDDRLAHPGLRPHLERMVLTSTLADDRAAWELASPQYHVRADAPPFFVIHGANDVFTSARQARRFAETLRAVSTQPVVHAELPYAQHAFDVLGSVRTHHTVRAIERFLDVSYCTVKS